MNKRIIISLCFVAVAMCGCSHKKQLDQEQYNKIARRCESNPERVVWVSTSPQARAYHIYEDCEYLNKTTYQILELDVSVAKSRKHLCRFCAERKYNESNRNGKYNLDDYEKVGYIENGEIQF